MIRKSVIDRIKSVVNIDTDECINYPILDYNGYGYMQTTLNRKKKHYRMHRVSFQVFNNVELLEGEIVCHKCDNPACVNPKHLFKGTHKDNSDDKVSKGRQAKGPKNGRYIDGRTYFKVKKPVRTGPIPSDIVLLVYNLRKEKTIKEVCKMTGVPESTVKDISCKRSYKKLLSFLD